MKTMTISMAIALAAVLAYPASAGEPPKTTATGDAKPVPKKPAKKSAKMSSSGNPDTMKASSMGAKKGNPDTN